MPDLGVTTEKSVHVSAEVAADTFEILLLALEPSAAFLSEERTLVDFLEA